MHLPTFDKKEATKWIIIGVIVFVILWQIRSWIKKPSESEQTKKREVDGIQIDVRDLTYPDNNVYLSIANRIDEGLDSYLGLSVNKKNVYTAFDLIKTNNDMRMLLKTYGVRAGKTLPEAIRSSWGNFSLLGYPTIPAINTILKNNGIDYKF